LANDAFEIYFGRSSDKRKVELSTPFAELPQAFIDNINTTKIIPCSYHLHQDTKRFQLDNLKRKLPSAVDGLVVSRRKVLETAIWYFGKNNNKPVKIFQFSGSVVEYSGYHHGDMSLNNTIMGMSQTFPGARMYPYLICDGSEGTRRKGGEDAGQPRYVGCYLNKKFVHARFPTCDHDLLVQTYEETKTCEPLYFVPVDCAPILDMYDVPATGWKSTINKRIKKTVDYNTRLLIDGDGKVPEGKKLKPMAIDMSEFKCKKVIVDGVMYAVGLCEYNESENTIIITELPPMVWTDDYIAKLRKNYGTYKDTTAASKSKTKAKAKTAGKSKDDVSPYIESIISHGAGDTIHIVIYLVGDAYSRIMSDDKYKSKHFSPLEMFLYLKTDIQSFLNYMGTDGLVKDFKSYEEVLYYWFNVRRGLYIRRVSRELRLAELHLKYIDNVIRFINMVANDNYTKKTKDQLVQTLEDNKFDKFNKSKLNSPRYLVGDALDRAILHDNATFDYLLNLSMVNLLADHKSTLVKSRKKYLDTIEYYKLPANNTPFLGAGIWKAELTELAQIIENGMNPDHGWE